MSEENMLIHLVAGGVAGTVGTIITCPLEVIKTRLQSSNNSYQHMIKVEQEQRQRQQPVRSSNTNAVQINENLNNRLKLNNKNQSCTFSSNILFRNNHLNRHYMSVMTNGFNLGTQTHFTHQHKNLTYQKSSPKNFQPRPGTGIYYYFKFIVKNEGVGALFKGLTPTLIGVAPYRAIYFFSYANSKVLLSQLIGEERTLLHICSAFIAGFSAVTVTNPIWFIKTRLQLDETRGGKSALEVINKIMKEKGILGFYKGITASYFGIAESAMYFSIYEKLKKYSNKKMEVTDSSYLRFLIYFASAGFSKSMASCICYPHEVARTRLREEGNKYVGFFQTLNLILKEEGCRGLYKGLATHLVRQIPNTAIVMTTYELIVNYFKLISFDSNDQNE